MRIFFLIGLIILIFPFAVLAHEGVHFNIEPGTLPDSPTKYLFKQVGEWLEVNIFTVSTKAKQEKKLFLAEERLAEFLALLSKPNPDSKALSKALRGYQYFLREAEDMAEKIIFLDGAEIGLAARFEEISRTHEKALAEFWAETGFQSNGNLIGAISTARIENEKVFKFMVKNYQFTQNDIKKHQAILDAHLEIMTALQDTKFLEVVPSTSKEMQLRELIEKARKYQAAGLNIEAYDFLQKAKNLLYSFKG